MIALQSVAAAQWALSLTGLFFFFALGAIVGSFINVLVYRLPIGKGIVTPPSACPHCDTPLQWKDNIPIFGWFLLGGKCRYCKTRISPEYFIVETIVALLFAWVASAWFLRPSPIEFLGLHVVDLRPEWAIDGLASMWPMLAQIYVLLGALVAITLIDARTFSIPLVLPWTVTIVALVAHPIHAAWMQTHHAGLRDSPFPWTIPTPTGEWLLGTLAGTLGLVISIVLLRARILPRSFADYEQWEQQAQAREAELAAAPSAPHSPPSSHDTHFGPTLRRVFFLTGPAIAAMFVGFAIGAPKGQAFTGMFIGMGLGLVVGMVLRRVASAPRSEGDSDPADPIWLSYPHARREMVKELAFVIIPLAAFSLAWYLGRTGSLPAFAADPPLWLRALAGSLLGYLVGGGLVWAVRILGSLAFGKEAMGLGDVHLMAAVGAVLGWIDPTLAFLVAPVFGLAWVAASGVLAKSMGRVGSALPFGPHLAVASAFVLLAKPVMEWVLGIILTQPMFNLP